MLSRNEKLSSSMVSFPPCKINLGLNIIQKRPDGYHDLETCFISIPWTDILEILPADNLTFTSSGNTIPGKDEDNLCLKAYHLLRKDFDLPPVQIHLHKIIPTGAGLGGGSSDAAYTLRNLNDIFQLQLSTTQLMTYAAVLGSDCAFFTQNDPMLGTGRGEILTPIALSLKGKYMVLVKPDIHVSTAEAYAGITPRTPDLPLHDILLQQPLSSWKSLLKNDFEESVFRKYPAIAELKNTLYTLGAVYACMSGSGSTVFGIFDTPPQLSFPEHFTVWSGVL